MKLLERFKNWGIVVTLSAVAGTHGFLVYEASQNRTAQNEIVTLINQRHIETLDRIASDSKDKIVAFKDSERICAVAQATIETTTYFKGKSIHGC